MNKKANISNFLYWLVISFCLLTYQISNVHAETIDYDLNQASRLVKAIDGDLQRLQEGDVATYNRISKKMEKAANHLQATQSKSHPEFETTVKHWGELQTQMATIAANWNAAAAQQQAETAAQQEAAQTEQQRQQAEAEKQAAAKPQVAPVNLDPLMDKYQRRNLPKLNEDATASDATSWAQQMLALQTTQKEADLALIDEALQLGAASQNDAHRVSSWISDSFQDTIKREVQNTMDQHRGQVLAMRYSVELIHSVEDGDGNGAFRVAGPHHGENNKVRLDQAIRSGEVVAAYAEVYDEQSNPENVEVAELFPQLKSARARIDELEPLAKKQEEVLANLPKKERVKNKDFLAALAQEFWLEGSIFAEIEKDGSVWIGSDVVGDITHNGEIWINGVREGSIEPNGEVWFQGNKVGSLEDNGEVWRGGNQVGLIDNEGTAWINGSPTGEIEPFNGAWKRAAILYYFSDFYRR